LREKTGALLARMGLAAPLATESPTPPVGLEAAELFLHDQSATFEFVTPEVKQWQVWLQKFDSKGRRTLLGIAAGLVLLPIVAFMYRSHVENSLTEEWRSIDRNVAQVTAIQMKIRRFRPWFDPNPTTLNALETLAAAFSDNGETWAKNIQIHDGQRVTCTAFAKSQAAKDEMLGRLRKKPGVTEVQTQQVRGNSPITYTFTYKWEPNHAN
jgi:Tfp pilus assembly protein PilN